MKRHIPLKVLLLCVALLGACGDAEEDQIDSLNPNTPSVTPAATGDSLEIEEPRD